MRTFVPATGTIYLIAIDKTSVNILTKRIDSMKFCFPNLFTFLGYFKIPIFCNRATVDGV